MTNTELIATKLLGWENSSELETDEYGFAHLAFNPEDWNDIRRMEDAIRAMDTELFDDYLLAVTKACEYDRRLAWLAPAAQRVAAAIRVLQEVGL